MKNVFSWLALTTIATPAIGRYWSFDFNSTNPFNHVNPGGNTFNCTRVGDNGRCNLFKEDVFSDSNGPYWDIARCYQSNNRCKFQTMFDAGVIDTAPLYLFQETFEVELILHVRTPSGISGPFLGFWQNFDYDYPGDYVVEYRAQSPPGPGTSRRFSLQFLGNTTHQMYVMSEGTLCDDTRINDVHAVSTTGPMRLHISVVPDSGMVTFNLSALNNPTVFDIENYNFPECPSSRTEASTLHWYNGMGSAFRLYRWWTAETADIPHVLSTTTIATTTTPTTTTTMTTTRATTTTRAPTPAPSTLPLTTPTPKSTTTSTASATSATTTRGTSTSLETTASASSTTMMPSATSPGQTPPPTTSSTTGTATGTGTGAESHTSSSEAATSSSTLADSSTDNSVDVLTTPTAVRDTSTTLTGTETLDVLTTTVNRDALTTSIETETIDLKSGEVDDELPWWWWIPLAAGLALCLLICFAVVVALRRRRRDLEEVSSSTTSGTYTMQNSSADEMSSARFDEEPVNRGVHYAKIAFHTGDYDNVGPRTSNYNYNYATGGVNMVVYSEVPGASTPSNGSRASLPPPP